MATLAHQINEGALTSAPCDVGTVYHMAPNLGIEPSTPGFGDPAMPSMFGVQAERTGFEPVASTLTG